MRKYIVGFIVGVLLTLPFAVAAETITSNVGKRIEAEFPVLLDGAELPVKAVAFEGTSYAPVRALAEALGLNVDFKNRTVILETVNKEDTQEVTETTYNEIEAIISNGKTYFSLKDYIRKFSPNGLYGWKYEKEMKRLHLVEYVSEESSVVKRKLFEVDMNDPATYIIYQGNTYLSVDYYREPADFAQTK